MENETRRLFLNSWLKNPDPISETGDLKTDIFVVQLTAKPVDGSERHRLITADLGNYVSPVSVSIVISSEEASIFPSEVFVAMAPNDHESREVEFSVTSKISVNPELRTNVTDQNSLGSSPLRRLRRYDSCFRSPASEGPLGRWKKGL